MNKVVHFELPADDMARAKKFYQDTFDWKLEDVPEMDYVMAETVELDENRKPVSMGAINGGLAERSGIVKQPSFALDTDDIDGDLEKIKNAGGKVVRAKTAVGENAFMAYFEDTEGNLLSLWSSK